MVILNRKMPRIDIDARHFYLIFRLFPYRFCDDFGHLLGAFGVGVDTVFYNLVTIVQHQGV
jgi:hypothetical protein